MEPILQAWHEQVQAAALSADQAALRVLFEQSRDLFGDGAAEHWAEAMSGLDASAQTG